MSKPRSTIPMHILLQLLCINMKVSRSDTAHNHAPRTTHTYKMSAPRIYIHRTDSLVSETLRLITAIITMYIPTYCPSLGILLSLVTYTRIHEECVRTHTRLAKVCLNFSIRACVRVSVRVCACAGCGRFYVYIDIR